MKKMFTKAVALAAAMMLSAALTGCGSSPASSSGNSTQPPQDTESATQAAQAETADNTPSESTQASDSAGTADESTQNTDTDAANAQSADSDMSYVKNKGTLVVGITNFKPMDYQDESGAWIGFDADMASAFAESLGVAVEFVEIDWDNKILELDGRTIDCVWNGMTLTAEVTSAMECSRPYCNNAQVIVVPADKAADFQDKNNIPEVSFAVEAGSAGEAQASALELAHTPVTAQADALMEVAAGTSDAAIIDSLMAAAMVGEGTGYADLVYTVGLNDEKYGVGFRKGSDLAAALNDFFAASTQDGSMLKTAEKYGVQAALITQQP